MGFSTSAPSCAILRVWHAARHQFAVWLLAGFVALTGIASGPGVVHADDSSLGTPNGDIYRRKGWDWPSINRKPAKSDSGKTAAQRTRPSAGRPATRTRTASNVKPGRKAARTKRRANRSSSKLRTAAKARPTARKGRRAAKRKIPARIVKRRPERKLKRNARRYNNRKYAVKVASLGVDHLTVPNSQRARKSVTGGSARVRWVANRRCVPGRNLIAAINYVARNFGRVRVNSTCRSRRHNRRVGGASRSWHLKSRAADIRVFGNIRKAARYLRRVVGGYKHYGGGLFHIDTGPRRSW